MKNSWTKSIMIFVAFMTTISLIIPALIVSPYSQPQPNKETGLSADTIEVIENENNTINSDHEDINVNVYRTEKDTVETMKLEEYVIGVVASEMPVSFELEALKAQALAARTYIVRQISNDINNVAIPENADITDSYKLHQVFKDNDQLAKEWGESYEINITKIKEAVHATKGQIITYEGDPIDPSYFSTSNGYTENSEDYWEHSFPYLRSVESPWDKESPKFNEQTILSIEEVEQSLNIQLDPNSTNIGEKKLTKSNRVDEIKIGEKTFSGVDVRLKLDLPSNDFDIEQIDSNFIFKTKGFGHGVGMSQYGANGMAMEGKNYKEIINHYYQEVSTTNINNSVDLVRK